MTETEWNLYEGDCIPYMATTMEPASIDFAVFSPPFPSLYAYTSLPEDIGNSEDLNGEAKLHLGYFYRGLARVLKPGRVAIVHVMQIPRLKRSGGGHGGLFDFRGMNIRLGERAGLIYDYDWVIRKNPQAQAIRTRSRELQFAGLETDQSRSRGALPDYLIKFRAPGENKVPIRSNVTRDEWIQWAECSWLDIRETNTLNTKEGKGEKDTKHICPLQLDVINRLIRLFSNDNELVFSPFAGIGSEGYIALKLGRRFVGCEIKPEYIVTAKKNFGRAISSREEDYSLFDFKD